MNSKKSIIIIILLALTTLGLGSFIIYDKLFPKDSGKSTSIQIDSVDISIDNMYEINEILNIFDKAFNDSTTKFFAYKNKKKLYMKNFDKEAAIFVSMYDEMEKSNNVQSIRESKIKSNFSKIFGNYLKYEKKNFDAGEGFKVEFSSGPYAAYIATIKSNELYPPEYITITTKTNLEEGKAIITRKLVYVEYIKADANGDVSQAILYKNANKGTELGRINLKNGEVNQKQIADSYGSKLSTYTYTFTFNKSKYSLYKINAK